MKALEITNSNDIDDFDRLIWKISINFITTIGGIFKMH